MLSESVNFPTKDCNPSPWADITLIYVFIKKSQRLSHCLAFWKRAYRRERAHQKEKEGCDKVIGFYGWLWMKIMFGGFSQRAAKVRNSISPPNVCETTTKNIEMRFAAWSGGHHDILLKITATHTQILVRIYRQKNICMVFCFSTNFFL